ncbi:MAG: magnesium chelatase domain-containing protein [Actinomycetota bacterium]
MDVRVWGTVEDRLIELRVEPVTEDPGIGIVGLPERRTRSTADRVRAALVNSRLVREAPPVTIRLEPAVQGGTPNDLDLAIALALLASVGAIGKGLRWILATGRLGLDGAVYASGVGPLSLSEVVETLCRTPVVGSNMCSRQRGADERAPIRD